MNVRGSFANRIPAWCRVALAMFAVGWGANQFAAMLAVYRNNGASTQTVTTLFAAYALGLVPALVAVALVSDRIGLQKIMRPVLVIATLATVALTFGGEHLWLLLVGRLAAGVASGAAFAPGTAWITDLSDGRPAGTGARRAGIALSAGFGSGPLVAGLLAQWAPRPTVVPYVPHLVLMAIVLVIAWDAPEPVIVRSDTETRSSEVWQVVRTRPFLFGIVLTAPWVFGAATTSFATIPTITHIGVAPIAVVGALGGLTLWTGVAVQPFARRLGKPHIIVVIGLTAAAIGLCVGLILAVTEATWLILPAAVLLGTAYGLILVGGLTTVEATAHPDDVGTLNVLFYSLTYIGFTAPLVSTVALTVISPAELMLVGIGVIAATIPGVLASTSYSGTAQPIYQDDAATKVLPLAEWAPTNSLDRITGPTYRHSDARENPTGQSR